MLSVEESLSLLVGKRGELVRQFHDKYISLFNKSKGSSGAHQFWDGGYRTHLTQCINYALHIHKMLGLNIPKESVIIALYFHDIEKLWKYSVGLPDNWDKKDFLFKQLKEQGIEFDSEEINALTYVHGEGKDYVKGQRTMGRLTAICHSADILSARATFDIQWMRCPFDDLDSL